MWRPTRAPRSWLLASCLVILPAGAVHAQSAQPDSSVRARAAELTARATSAYRAADYTAALQLFERAYARVPAPELLFNVGQCLRQLQRDEQAERAFQAYLRERPAAPERAEIERWIASNSRPRAPELSPIAARLPPSPAATPKPKVDELERSFAVRRTANEPPPARQDDAPSITERWWFWTAVGVVAVGGGITAGLLLNQDDDAPAAGSLGTVRWD
jgi:tetratricopeptide (TPR) repeat protein